MDVKFGLYRHVMFTLCAFAQCNVNLFKERFVLNLLVVTSHEGKQGTAKHTSPLSYLDPKLNSPSTFLNQIYHTIPMEVKALRKEENAILEEIQVWDGRKIINGR